MKSFVQMIIEFMEKANRTLEKHWAAYRLNLITFQVKLQIFIFLGKMKRKTRCILPLNTTWLSKLPRRES